MLSYNALDLIGLFNRRVSGEIDLYERHRTVELAWDRHITGAGQNVYSLFLELYTAKRLDVIARFDWIANLPKYGINIDAIALNAIEGTSYVRPTKGSK